MHRRFKFNIHPAKFEEWGGAVAKEGAACPACLCVFVLAEKYLGIDKAFLWMGKWGL